MVGLPETCRPRLHLYGNRVYQDSGLLPRNQLSDKYLGDSVLIANNRPMRLRPMHIAKVMLFGVVGMVLLAAVCGVSYRVIVKKRDARRFPQEGRSVDLGRTFSRLTLNLNCTGSGSPTVILDAGLGSPSLEWYLVQPKVAQFARVCSYDRAGYGWSAAGPMPRRN